MLCFCAEFQHPRWLQDQRGVMTPANFFEVSTSEKSITTLQQDDTHVTSEQNKIISTLLTTGHCLSLQAIQRKIICRKEWVEYFILARKCLVPYMKLKYLTKNLPLLDHLLRNRVTTCSKWSTNPQYYCSSLLPRKVNYKNSLLYLPGCNLLLKYCWKTLEVSRYQTTDTPAAESHQ